MLGKLFEISRPGLGIGYHYVVNDDTVDPWFEGLTSNYDGPEVVPLLVEVRW
jgi:ribonuclease Z